MDNAFHIMNNQAHSAYRFSRPDIGTISQLRRFLECPTCHVPAFFRKAARNEQAACFGARPHSDGCTEGTPLSRLTNGEDDDEDVLHSDEQRIILDLNYDATGAVNHINNNMDENGAERRVRSRGSGNRPNAIAHCRLNAMLKSLVINPVLRVSEQEIETEDEVRTISNFFVSSHEASQAHIGRFRGYWGQTADVREENYEAIWLNSGTRDGVSLRLPLQMQRIFLERFDINGMEDLVGSYTLCLGNLKVSQNNKKYVVINELVLVTYH